MFYKVIVFLARILVLLVFRLRVRGIGNIPKKGGMILAVNHRSDFDPIIAALACPRQLTFMAKSELFKNPVIGKILKLLGAFPVQRGKGDIGAVKSALSILGSGKVMLIFPEGRRVRKGEKSKAQPGVAMIAQRAKVPVVPVCISGDYKWMKKITVSFGEAVSLEEYYGKKLNGDELQSVADGILEKIHELSVG